MPGNITNGSPLYGSEGNAASVWKSAGKSIRCGPLSIHGPVASARSSTNGVVLSSPTSPCSIQAKPSRDIPHASRAAPDMAPWIHLCVARQRQRVVQSRTLWVWRESGIRT